MTDIDEVRERLAKILQDWAEQYVRPLDPKEIAEGLALHVHPDMVDVDSVSYVDDDDVLHALVWGRLPPPNEHIEIEVVPYDG